MYKDYEVMEGVGTLYICRGDVKLHLRCSAACRRVNGDSPRWLRQSPASHQGDRNPNIPLDFWSSAAENCFAGINKIYNYRILNCCERSSKHAHSSNLGSLFRVGSTVLYQCG